MFTESPFFTKKILINLKVISRIEKGDRLYANKQILELDKGKGLLTAFYRWFKEESREQTIYQIHYILENAIMYISNSIYHYDFYTNNKPAFDIQALNFMISELEMSIGGLTNLKKTYQDDATIVAKIDVEIDLIRKQLTSAKQFLIENKLVIELHPLDEDDDS